LVVFPAFYKMIKQKIISLLLSGLSWILANSQIPELVLPTGHTAPVLSVAFSPNGQYLTSLSEDKTAIVWEVETGNKLVTLDYQKEIFREVRYNSTGDFLALISDSGIVVYNLNNKEFAYRIKDATGIQFDPQGNSGWVYGKSGQIFYVNFETSKIRITQKLVLDGALNSVMYQPLSNALLLITDSAVFDFNIKKKKIVKQMDVGDRIINSVLSPDENYFLILTDQYFIRVLSNNWDKKDTFPEGYYMPQLLPSKAGGHLLVMGDGFESNMVELFETNNFKRLFSSDTIYSIYDTIAVEENGIMVAKPAGKYKITIPRHLKYRAPCLSENGQFLKAGNVIWNFRESAKSYEFDEWHLMRTDFTSDSKYFIIQNRDYSLSLIRAYDGEIIRAFKGLGYSAEIAAMSRNGNFCALKCNDSVVRVFDFKTAAAINYLKGHKKSITSIKFNTGGNKILTMSEDSTARIWDVATGHQLASYHPVLLEYNPASFDGDSDLVYVPEIEYDTMVIEDIEDPEKQEWIIRPRLYEERKFQFYLSNVVTHSTDLSFAAKTEMDYERNIYDSISIFRSDTLYYSGRLNITTNETGSNSVIKKLEFSYNNKYLFIADHNKYIHVFDLERKKKIWEATGTDFIYSADPDIIGILRNGSLTFVSCKNANWIYSYVSVDVQNYITTDYHGRYDGTEMARNNLYFLCGREIIKLEQFKSLAWEPDLVAKINGVNKEPISAKAISEIDLCGQSGRIRQLGLIQGKYTFEVIPGNQAIEYFEFRVNDKIIKVIEAKNVKKHKGIYKIKIDSIEVSPYLISGAENKLTLRTAWNSGALKSRGENIIIKPVFHKSPTNIYIVSIGISEYKGEKLKLSYASKDARDIYETMNRSARLFLNDTAGKAVHSYCLNTTPEADMWPDKLHIKQVFQRIMDSAKADDIVFVFFAGHGILESGNSKLFLLSADAADFNIQGVQKDVAISTTELNTWMQGIKANKQILILDACNSGQALSDLTNLLAARNMPADQRRALENLKDETGICILSASASGQSAYETSIYNQGLLTYSLLSGIKFGSGLRDNRFIDVNLWFANASENVGVLAKEIGGRQDPQIMGNGSYSIGMVSAAISDSIYMPELKQLFKRSKMIQDEELLNDDLELSSWLDRSLTTYSYQKNSRISFIADNTFSSSYSIRGRYNIQGDSVVARISLIIGQKEKVYQFEIAGKSDNPEKMALEIVERIAVWLHEN